MSPTIVLAALATLLAGTALAWALSLKAVRVDRLHRQVLGARATLESQLVHRAQAAVDLAATGALDPASATILAGAAHEVLDSSAPLVDDGLDPEPLREPLAPTGVPGAGQPGATAGRERALAESDLTRVIRTVLDPTIRQVLAEDPLAGPALSRLDRASYRLVLARRFHDTHVTEARRLRSSWDVRLLHLAGHAPMPGTFDVDDDTTPTQEPA